MLPRQVRRPAPSLIRRAVTSLGAIVCCVFPAVGQQAMAVHETRYVLRAGEAVAIQAPQETLDFLANARSRQVDIVTPDAPVSAGRLVAAPNRDGGQVLLGASLRMSPGEYTVKLSAASAAGEQRQTTLAVTVLSMPAVPSNAKRPPVVLLNGWETGFTDTCPIAGD